MPLRKVFGLYGILAELEHLNAAMRDVTIPDGQEPDGAVAALVVVLGAVEWVGDDRGSYCPWCEGARPHHASSCDREALLARFKVGTRDGEEEEG